MKKRMETSTGYCGIYWKFIWDVIRIAAGQRNGNYYIIQGFWGAASGRISQVRYPVIFTDDIRDVWSNSHVALGKEPLPFALCRGTGLLIKNLN